MHILVVNDDGPPSPQSSPYVHTFVRELQAAGHIVSVCLPHTQRSWIGKAHMIGQAVHPTYYRPPPLPQPAAGLLHPEREGQEAHGTTHPHPSSDPVTEEWILVDGTPASCVQIGLHHFFSHRGPFDLVLSGPNFGRNTTACFALSSGTLGGALEAAGCKRRAIALSYAFFSRNHDTEIIKAASRQSVRVLEALMRQWPADGSVDLYSVNVPLVEGVEGRKVLWANMLQNYWGDESLFTEAVKAAEDDSKEEKEARVREREKKNGGSGESAEDAVAAATAATAAEALGTGTPGTGTGLKHKTFTWSPRFADVYRSVEESQPGNDGWAVKEGYTSVTPLKANFWNAAAHLYGQELQLEPAQKISNREEKEHSETRGNHLIKPTSHFYALIDYQDDYVQPLILSAMEKLFPRASWTLLTGPANATSFSRADLAHPATATAGISRDHLLPSAPPTPPPKMLQISPYEAIDFDYAIAHPHTTLINSYVIRKALIRKHFLSDVVNVWTAKNADSVLRTHVMRAEAFELDYAEFLDDALVEAFDLRASLERNEAAAAGCTGSLRTHKTEWWILKPSMSDRGQGIRLFSTMEQLQGIFAGWEAERSDSDDSEEEQDGAKQHMRTSHLRHFVAQPYIDPPLLLPQLGSRKFHIRVYVLALGAIRVYVYRDMLALFAAKAYRQPPSAPSSRSLSSSSLTDGMDLDAHLTNTCLQGEASTDTDSVHRFWELPLPHNGVTHEDVWKQICCVTGELFEAAARGSVVHFQPLPQAFEVFGLDFLVDARGTAWLLEVNSFPDFRQTGRRLHGVVAAFWAEVLRLAVGTFAGGKEDEKGGSGEMMLVREVDLGRR